MPKTVEPIIDADVTKMSVVEILTYAELGFCGDQVAYYKYGNDLRAMWNALRAHTGHWGRVRSSLGIPDRDSIFPEQMIDAVSSFFDPTHLAKSHIAAVFKMQFKDSWLKNEFKDKTLSDDVQYEFFLKQLQQTMYQRLECRGLPFKRAVKKKDDQPKKAKASNARTARRSSKKS